MKRILSLVVVLVFFISANAQDLSEALQAKNDGNEAYRNKDYVTAIENWEKYLNSEEEGVDADENTLSLYNKSFKYAANDFMKAKNYASAYKYFQLFIDKNKDAEKDGKVAYTMAYCADKMDNTSEALSLYQKAIDLEYKEDAASLYIANIYKKAGEEAKMKEVLIDAMDKYSDSKYKGKMATMLIVPMLKDAAEPFNTANELAKNAASNDPNEYLTNMAKAVAKFEEAIPMFEKVLKYDPNNEQANTYLKACQDNITAFNEYKANLNNK